MTRSWGPRCGVRDSLPVFAINNEPERHTKRGETRGDDPPAGPGRNAFPLGLHTRVGWWGVAGERSAAQTPTFVDAAQTR